MPMVAGATKCEQIANLEPRIHVKAYEIYGRGVSICPQIQPSSRYFRCSRFRQIYAHSDDALFKLFVCHGYFEIGDGE